MKKFTINSCQVGIGQLPFIIAEAGINHNGELDKALEMIKVAKKAGADAIKFQTFKAEEFVGDPNQMFSYQSQGRQITESMLAMFRRYEFPKQAWFEIKKACDHEGILFLSTPQNRSDLDLLIEVGVPAIKIGSDDFTNLPLIRSYVETGLPLILSCGMADMAEVHQALEAAGALNGYPVVLLLCTSQYPTPPADVNLLKLKTLQAAFPGLLTGFSDHTQGSLASSLAVAMGAVVFEKHFTLSHDLPGPDHWFSEDPDSLHKWVQDIRKAHSMMGQPALRPTEAEQAMRKVARRSLVTTRKISKGEQLTAENIGARRPGNGLHPDFISKILGNTARHDLEPGTLLSITDIA